MNAVQEARQWLKKQTVDPMWRYDDKLNSEQISALLEGGVAWMDVREKLIEYNLDFIATQEHGWRVRAANEFDVDIGELYNVYPKLDMDMATLAHNANAHFAVPLGITHDVNYAVSIEYDHIEGELEQLGVNPHDIREDWPDMPDRTDPLVDPDDVAQVWIDNHRICQWVALLDADDVIDAAIKGTLDKHTILKAGATVTTYDYWNGAGSTFAETKRDCEIDPEAIVNDDEYMHGINKCYGPLGRRWNGKLMTAEQKAILEQGQEIVYEDEEYLLVIKTDRRSIKRKLYVTERGGIPYTTVTIIPYESGPSVYVGHGYPEYLADKVKVMLNTGTLKRTHKGVESA